LDDGRGGVVASFLDAGAIDEFIVHVVPVLIGAGIPLIQKGKRTVRLALNPSEPFEME
jgi:dihydrofolate reductase